MKNKSIFLFSMLSVLILVSSFIANNIALWIVSIVVIAIAAFLFFDLNKDSAKIKAELEELRKTCESKTLNANEDNDIRDEIIDVLEN